MTLAITTSQNIPRRAIVTICSNNYFPYARVLFSSLQRYHPEASLFLCLADIKESNTDLGIEEVEVIEARSLDIRNFSDFAFRYDIMEFNTAVKPFILRKLIEERDFEQVVYLDPDIEMFAPMTSVFDALDGGADFVLTPHLTAPAEFAEFPNDIGIMKSGIYNLGFIALSNSLDVINFLHWWGRHLRFECLNLQEQGLFVDQKFVDLVPGFYDNVTILRDCSLNVAYWNLDLRSLEENGEGWLVDGKPLTFFHFSGIIPKNPNRLSKHTSRFNGNLEPALQSLIEHYISQLKKFGLESKPKPNYAYGTFSNGIAIVNLIRECYRMQEGSWPEDPFETFHLYLTEFSCFPIVNYPYPISNLMYFLWTKIEGLQKKFDIGDTEGRKDYSLWFIEKAENLGIDKYFLIPVVDSLQGKYTHHPPVPDRAAPPPKRDRTKKTPLADIEVIGYLRAETGVGQGGRMVACSLEKVGVNVKGYNVTVNVLASQKDLQVEHLLTSEINARIHIYRVNADQLAIVKDTVKPYRNKPEFTINIPAWELSVFPEAWLPNFAGIDEIWVDSQFVRDSLPSKVSIPVIYLPPAVTVDELKVVERSRFNLPTNAFLFHFNFDFSSYINRKNPQGLIQAYRSAFRDRPGEVPTALVIKTRGYDITGKSYRQLMEFVEGESDIIIINEDLSYGETLGLMNCCDCYVSLHRSEGFGFTVAEAMLLGKPVITTDYSSTTDFVNSSTGFPVKYQLKPLELDEYPFAEGQKWADPDIDYAAWLMRQVIRDPLKTKTIALAGKEKIGQDYCLEAVGKRYLDRLLDVLPSLKAWGF